MIEISFRALRVFELSQDSSAGDEDGRIVGRCGDDHFKLAFHREIKQLPVYELVVGKNGPKLTASGSPSPGPGFITIDPPGHVVGRQVKFEGLVGLLQRRSGRLVLDKTGLAGVYDFTFEWEEGSPDAQASLLKAVQQQLGLELRDQTAPVASFVIDHAEQVVGDQ